MRCALWLMLAGAVLSGSPARACSIPVFRYALERWKPTPYEMHVFHRGPLTPDQKALLARFEKTAGPANLEIRAIDLAGNVGPEALALWQKQPGGASLPRLVVRYSEAEEADPPLRSGTLDEKTLAGLIDSPARRQIVKLLARGESAVWVLLGGDDPRADEAAARLLERELARLQKEIKLPELSDEGPTLLTSLPLKVSFAVVRVDRRQAREDTLVRLLLSSEAGLEKAKGPMVFPIIGRGRVLCGLADTALEAKEIEETARWLCKACSCEVKELNPGIDLLASADWEELLEREAEEKPTATPPLPTPKVPTGLVAVGPPATKESASPCTRCRLWMWGGGGTLAVLLLAGAWALQGKMWGPRRGRRSSAPAGPTQPRHGST